MFTGPTGTGKTLLALRWLVEGAKEGEAGLFVTFNESPGELIQVADSFGWKLDRLIEDKLITISHVPPIEFNIDQHVYNIQLIARKQNVKRLVIDSISTFEIGMTDKVKFTDYVWGITNFFSRKVFLNYSLMKAWICLKSRLYHGTSFHILPII